MSPPLPMNFTRITQGPTGHLRFTTVRRSSFGFGLPEMLIAIAVLIVFVALLVPIYQKVVQLSKQTKCLNNLRQYGTSMLCYVSDQGRLPRWNGKGSTNLEGTTRPSWEVWVRPYLHRTFAMRLRCPKITPKYRQPGSSNYAFNYGGNSALCIYYPSLRDLPVPASRVVFAAETNEHELGFNHVVHLNGTMWGIPENVASASRDGYESNESDRAQYHGSPRLRSLNLMFLDGHAAPVSIPEGKDWRSEPTYGTLDNGGYFFDRNQFKKLSSQ